MNAMQCVFTGPPRVGKSSFWQRVLGIMPEKLMPSTDITSSDGPTRLDIRGSCGFAVNVSELEWKKLLVEEEMEGFVGLVTQQGAILNQEPLSKTIKAIDMEPGAILNQEPLQAIDMEPNVMENVTKEDTHPSRRRESRLGALMRRLRLFGERSPHLALPGLTNQQAPTISGPVRTPEHLQQDDSNKSEEPNALYMPSNTSGATTSIIDPSSSVHSVKSLTHMEGQTAGELSSEELPSPSQVLEQALIMMREAEATKNIDSASFVYFTDTGGQPEFQEALSLLMAGCNTVLIVLNLEHDLHSNPTLEYLPSLDEPPIHYNSSFTVGEMLCQSLMSIPIGEDKEEKEEGTREGTQNAASVLFIGTHKDTVTQERIKEMNRDLIDLIKDTPQYQTGVVRPCSADDIIFAVDNFSPLQNDEDFIPI